MPPLPKTIPSSWPDRTAPSQPTEYMRSPNTQPSTASPKTRNLSHTQGNEPPHVHIDKGAGTLKVWLNDLTVASSERLKPVEIRAALELARQHQKTLLDAWNEFETRKN